MAENMSELARAIASVKAAKELIEADPAALQKHQQKFLSNLLDAYGSLFRAEDERRELLKRIEKLESIEAVKERYEMVSLADNIVAFAPIEGSNMPPHFLCADCMYAGTISQLKQLELGEFYHRYHCNTHGQLDIPVPSRQRPQTSYSVNRGRPQSWMGV